jgi:hypothetical protein
MLTNFSANEDFFAVFRTRLTNMDLANECFSGCARCYLVPPRHKHSPQRWYLHTHILQLNIGESLLNVSSFDGPLKEQDLHSTLRTILEPHHSFLVFVHINFSSPYCVHSRSQCRRRLRRGSASAPFLEFRVRIPPGAFKTVCYVCVMFCQVEVSAAGRSPDQRNPTECGVSEYDLKTR